MNVTSRAMLADTISNPVAPIRSRWPRHEQDEIEAAIAVLASGRVNSLVHGDNCRAFEAEFAALCDMPHAIALANGTVALEVALKALGVGPGDEVVVTPRSFFASAACIVTCGALPVFADVDPVSQNVTAQSIAHVLTPRTRAILPVHLAGWPCPMPEIMTLARAYGLVVVEDCAQALGATIDDRPVGSFGDAAAFSFCTDKIISTGGEGGMLVLRDAEVHARAWALKDHGKSLAALRNPSGGSSFRWVHDGFGSNYRMTEVQAAIGRAQLRKLPGWLARRRSNAAALLAGLDGLPALRLAVPEDGIGHAWYKFYAFLRPERLRADWSRDRIVEAAVAAGVPCFTGSCPEIYRERAFGNDMRLPVAQALGETSLMLPVDHTLGADDMGRMAMLLRAIIETSSR